MTSIPGNYKRKSSGICPLCSKSEDRTEHYFKCKLARQLAEVWNVTVDDLKDVGGIDKLWKAANFIEKVEVMLEAEMISEKRTT